MKINDKDLARFSTSYVSADKEGWLWKKGEINTSYQKRWCILKGNLFFYFEKKFKKDFKLSFIIQQINLMNMNKVNPYMRSDREPIGVIVLENSFVQLSDGADSSFTFSIHFTGEGSRVYKLTADDEPTCVSWIRALSICTYRYLKILVDELEQNVEVLEVKRKVQNLNCHGDSASNNQLKTINVYSKAKCHAPKRFSKSLVKSKSMPNICEEISEFKKESDEDDFLDFNIFSEKSKVKSKKISKSHESLRQSVTGKLVKKDRLYVKRSSPKISKKMLNFKSSKNPHNMNTSIIQSCPNDDVEANLFLSKQITFFDLHEQYRKDIANFLF